MASTNPVQSKKKKTEDLQHDLLTLARDHFKKPENEYQAMARNWAFKLERMTAEQRRLAEKFINEILFEGEEGNLRRHSVIINPNNQYPIPSSPSSVPYIQSPISHTQSTTPQSPSPVPYVQSSISYTQSTIPQTPSPASHIQSPIYHSQNQAQTLSNTEQPVLIHVPDSQTNETEAQTAAKYLKHFYSF